MADRAPWITDNPCDTGPLTEAEFNATVIGNSDGLYALHQQLWAMRCGEPVAVLPAAPVPLWKQTMTEVEVLAAVFNGYTIPPAQVPLPGSGSLMAAIVAMALLGRMWRE